MKREVWVAELLRELQVPERRRKRIKKEPAAVPGSTFKKEPRTPAQKSARVRKAIIKKEFAAAAAQAIARQIIQEPKTRLIDVFGRPLLTSAWAFEDESLRPGAPWANKWDAWVKIRPAPKKRFKIHWDKNYRRMDAAALAKIKLDDKLRVPKRMHHLLESPPMQARMRRALVHLLESSPMQFRLERLRDRLEVFVCCERT